MDIEDIFDKISESLRIFVCILTCLVKILLLLGGLVVFVIFIQITLTIFGIPKNHNTISVSMLLAAVIGTVSAVALSSEKHEIGIKYIEGVKHLVLVILPFFVLISKSFDLSIVGMAFFVMFPPADVPPSFTIPTINFTSVITSRFIGLGVIVILSEKTFTYIEDIKRVRVVPILLQIYVVTLYPRFGFTYFVGGMIFLLMVESICVLGATIHKAKDVV